MTDYGTTPDGATSPLTRSDDELLRLYATGNDREALEELLRRYADLAYGTAMQVCRHQADAQDAVQAAFVKIMQSASRYRGGSEKGVRVWITKIVIGCCKDRIRSAVRRRKWEQLAADEQETKFASAPECGSGSKAELASAVMAVLGSLPERYRLPITLHHWQGLSLKQTAESLAVPEETARTQLRRGMEMLKHQLAAGGVSVSMASLSALLPTLIIESAPRALTDSIAGIAAGKIGASAAVPAAGSLIVRVVTVVLVLSAGAGFALKIWSDRKAGQTATPVQVVVPRDVPAAKLYHKWDFNAPGIPQEFKVLSGKLTYVPGVGVEKSGCLEARDATVRIDIPVTAFPVRVSFMTSTRDTQAKQKIGFGAGTQWLPARSLVLFSGINEVPGVNRGDSVAWTTHTDYYNGTYISRWNNGRIIDIFVVPMERDGRITLQVVFDALIDNMVLESVSTNELPDVRKYMEAYDRIPAGQRRGAVRLPSLTRGRNPENPAAVSVRFYTNITEVAEGSELK